MALAVLGYLPALLANGSSQPLMAAANGQCLLFTREAYAAIGGHERVAGTVLDDVVFARAVKRSGRRLRMVDGAGLVGCRMYRGWAAARDGFGKNILAGYGGSLAALAAATLFHWLVFIGPWIWLAAGALLPAAAPASGSLAGSWPVWPLALAATGIAVRALTAAATRQRAADALLMPVSVVAMTLVALRAASWARSGGPRWKGRVAPAGRR
jgi:chlorobactene glucosyltransferase